MICIQMRILWRLLKKSFAVSWSVGWLKLNSSCIAVIVYSLQFTVNSRCFCLTVQRYYSRLLKLVSISRKKQKKCKKMHFFLRKVHFSDCYAVISDKSPVRSRCYWKLDREIKHSTFRMPFGLRRGRSWPTLLARVREYPYRGYVALG